MAQSKEVLLPTGVLRFRGEPGNTLALEDLCGFGARRNPKRGFVLVSKVLGKHLPSQPSRMHALHRQLARDLPAPREHGAPMLFIGMAETATGLGHGVFEAFVERAPHCPALFLQTTRYPLAGAARIEFEEEHSHATHQYLYLPERQHERALLALATSAVLVDDEASTGRTFVNLARALRPHCPALDTVHAVTLTDFTEGALPLALGALEGITQARSVALWKGALSFERDPRFQVPPVPAAFAEVGCRRRHISGLTARLGLSQPIRLAAPMVERCARLLGAQPTLVLGTGECMHPAFRLALALEQRGHQVHLQSTTRSPLMLGAAIEHVLQVPDVYGEGIPNYLYNRCMTAGARAVVVHESRERGPVDALLRQLDAIEFDLNQQQVSAPPAERLA